jgi:CubicO group peptidase (beta-lactamase class C family)
MLQLVEEGRLSLDDPISRWVSGYEQIDPAITVRQILNHTSGIYDWEDNPRSVTGLFASEGYPAIDWGHSWTLDDVMALVEEPDFPPGESWHYSNTGYYLARVIIEAETGMPISEALRTRLLDPLGLDDTWVECDQPAPEGVEFAHAWVDVNGDTNFDDISAQPNTLYCTILSSPIWTTAEDLARWSQALFHEGRVLSQGSLDEMLTFVPATTDPTEPMVREYGLGVGKFNFGVIATGDAAYLEHLDHYGHGGDVIGYNALMIYLPQHHATVVALFNENATINTTAGPLLEVVDRNLSEGKENGAFDTASGWTLVAGLVGIVVVVSSIAFVWRARAGGRRGEGASALAGLVALGLILVALGIEDRLVSYSLIGAGVVIAVLAAIFRSRLGGR